MDYDFPVDETSVIHINGSLQLPPVKVKRPEFGLFFLVCVGVIFGNIVLIVAIVRNKISGNRRTTNYFVMSLAVSDLIVGTFVLPTAVVGSMVNGWIFEQLWCELWQTFDSFACTASILNLCCVSLDRYWAISEPLNYRMKMKRSYVLTLIATVWIMSASLTFPPMVWNRIYDYHNVCNTEVCNCDPLFYELKQELFMTLTTFFIPLVVMMIVNYRTYRITVEKIWSESLDFSKKKSEVPLRNQSRKRDTSGEGQKRLLRKQYKLTKTLGIIMGIFVICWLPHFVLNLISLLFPSITRSTTINMSLLFQLSLWLGWINSGINPAIYTLLSKKFRDWARECIKCKPQQQRNNNQRDFKSQASQSSVC